MKLVQKYIIKNILDNIQIVHTFTILQKNSITLSCDELI